MMSAPEFAHVPVMRDEIVALFASVPRGFVLDATLGGAGHAVALLEAHEHLSILGVDRDPNALAAARARLNVYADRVRTSHRRFDDIDGALDDAEVSELSGALFDLGVSSHQFDAPERGFSYRQSAPLDMRMNPMDRGTADDLVNEADESTLARILRDYSDERFAGRIARAIVAARPIHDTVALADIVAAAIPAPARRRGGHPAKRTFQALRIAVNNELEILPTTLDRVIGRTVRGGRVAVLSYHSGEDRIVKERFRFHSTGGCTCPRQLPCGCGAVSTVRLVRTTSTPSDIEVESNPRSASARLRVVEVI
ncbi:MAG: 16S rRNA (cytosine(1402)-N(4))-methyltransferase RsmH [Acidimicrobiia bacterium]|jgi:16S rRNA (cytosine1402-N4)-methyltransferase|nr:16S rRNA (cytosine(1402)-N(4))-methyltransferase RsmH [Actinomycetota bacterium]NDB06530.1 16S rRNA (cytosine(1402)-N(4))-methyltransferase RsmH [Acidimicrobiia bacterium]NDA79075.1 16S rRNA (cytosine(1402)-N(4))-methyltransferase RsmH [Actinomycetota bacterium]NDD96441.1 16S rRNA (cytosine(1402)-N(4))-methyltransferase RsmH [Actinomycetota bacterium]NDE60496.1 16S rRNA (cytosine(1402)-N(4))-methyltransferase RsmH [Acidimicrobiia bacterium]